MGLTCLGRAGVNSGTAVSLFSQGFALIKAYSKEVENLYRMAQFTFALGRVQARFD